MAQRMICGSNGMLVCAEYSQTSKILTLRFGLTVRLVAWAGEGEGWLWVQRMLAGCWQSGVREATFWRTSFVVEVFV
jgi:hypothetical protein